jgi:hypothetical protein
MHIRIMECLIDHAFTLVDSLTWKHIHDKWPYFSTNVCSIQLGLTFDGVNPFGDLSSCHSTWLVIVFNYNLLPCLVTK